MTEGFLRWIVVLALAAGCSNGTTTHVDQGIEDDPDHRFDASTAKPTVTAPATLSIYPGQTNVPLVVNVSNASGEVTLSLSGLPAGVTAPPVSATNGATTLLVSAALAFDLDAFESGPMVASADVPISVVATADNGVSHAAVDLQIVPSNPSYEPDASDLDVAVVRIDTSGVAIADKTTDVPGTITITAPDGQTSYLPSSTATFHLRGNSTLLMPKKSYKVKLDTSVDLLTAMGLVCPYTKGGASVCDKSKSYALLANYADKSLLRNWAASSLANAIPMGGAFLTSPANAPTPSGTSTLLPWAPHSLFVELWVNGAYEGAYQLVEDIKIDSHRIDIDELDDTDTDDITGGYLLEIDAHGDADYVFSTPQSNLTIDVVDPDASSDPAVQAQLAYITSYVGQAETALFSADFTEATGWRAYFDEAALVNFYLVNELMGNVDGGALYSSDYFYKAKDDAHLYFGPVWDFDISAGNTNYAMIVDPSVPWVATSSAWFVRWFEDPSFVADVATQWRALRSRSIVDVWLSSITSEAALLQKAQAHNYQRWPTLGIEVWPNSEAAGTYQGEVDFLTSWLEQRVAYLDAQYGYAP